ncbi:acyl-CoA Delta-9 desaturase-like [Chrysoperla carnea]|uniref:acyl-CoA Delta-9 desaturase-like n=1 Tax=Chrysoperla carnea TaxID=189513 RepID=UPI001D076877|nr:acyl-CoA Delta-9 desaturase-like [Chrysoperla carnea]
MSPNPTNVESVLYENEYEELLHRKLLKEKTKTNPPLRKRKYEYNWLFILFLTVFHIQASYGIYLSFTSAKLLTNVFAIVLHLAAFFGATAGTHRLWSHRSYKATWQLKLIFMILQTLAFQNSIYIWCLDHRMHHKYSDTDADPHDTRRGFFFAHIGWLMVKPHPELVAKRKLIDMSDLKNDPFVRFQIRYYLQLVFLLFAFLPTIIPWYFWDESLTNAWFVAVCLRYMVTVHLFLLINSWAHRWGTQPYDTGNSGYETLTVALLTMGEGWHNYHHAFPWDYRAGELSSGLANSTAFLLKLFAKIGWAYDLKTVSDDMIKKRTNRTGDGSHSTSIWGWGDREQSDENKRFVTIEN